MKKASLASISGPVLALSALSALAGCNGGSGTSDTSGIGGEAKPFREEYKEVLRKSFPLSGDGAIKTLTIGKRVGAAAMANFANRGDVEVLFDLDTEEIAIEMRRYAFQADQTEADETFAKMSLWTYVNGSAPKKPDDMDPADDCSASATWLDGCYVLVYYDGLSQPVRVGADFKVHLPKAYRQSVVVNTEDNIEEGNYKLRGDVKLMDLCGSADVALSSGKADVRFCRELAPGPTCTAQQIQQCDDFQVDMMPAPWDKTCPCTTFGKLNVEAKDPYAGSITIDIPFASVWSTMTLRNDKSGQTTQDEDLYCTASVDNCPTCTVEQSADTPWKASVELNYPGFTAPKGAGYAITAVSAGCEEVFYVDGPDDFDPEGVESPKSEERGNILVCDGCLAGG